jgi:aminoglycoside phosphotransferase (APT) family kinase protein
MADAGEASSAAAALLVGLLRKACLPEAVSLRRLTGRGFGDGVYVASLTDGRRVVLRRWRRARAAEGPRAAFLAAHGVPAPRLLAGTAAASLHEFVPGALLGDLIETGRVSGATWRQVGAAFRRLHAVRFPAGLCGEVRPDRIVLRPDDPAGRLHTDLDACVPGLRRRAPDALRHLPALHELVDRAAAPLRAAPTALGHGDVHIWNIIIDGARAWLIDWEEPRVKDPAEEVALLDKHAALFNGRGLDPAFFDGYGHPPAEPNTSLHRVVQTVRWAASGDWDAFARRRDLPAELHERTRQWLGTLLAYVAQLPAHIERVRLLV